MPPIRTVTGLVVRLAESAEPRAPSTMAGSTGPRPVANRVIVSPAAAGCEETPGREPAGPTIVPSALVAIACWVPRLRLKSAGANGSTSTAIGCEATPARLTTTFVCPGVTPQGTCALIRLSDTNTSGAAVPPIVTESTSPSFDDTGTELETDSPEASPLPKIEMSEPGAMIECEPAALTTPLGWIVGV